MPWDSLRFPALAERAMGRPGIGFPFRSMAATEINQVGSGEAPSAGTARITIEDTATTLTVEPALVPPPGDELFTATDIVPALERSAAGTTPVSWVAETNCVVIAVPFRSMADPDTKLDPEIVNVVSGAPAAMTEGVTELRVGTGLFTVKFIELEDPPPGAGLDTTTAYCPPLVRSDDCSERVSCVELTNVAVWNFPLKVTVELERKFVPVMVTDCVWEPAVTEEGERLAMLGRGFDDGWEEEEPPLQPVIMRAREKNSRMDRPLVQSFVFTCPPQETPEGQP